MDKILELFIKNPEKDFHIRQVSKLIKKSPSTISKYLRKLEKEGVLISKRKLNHFLFKANSENKKFRLLKLNYNFNVLNDSGFIEYLIKEFNYPKAIVLFGSFSKAEDIPSSDIDLMIVSPLKKEVELEKFEKKLNHEIHLLVYSEKKIKEMCKTNKELLNNMINGIVIYGLLEVC